MSVLQKNSIRVLSRTSVFVVYSDPIVVICAPIACQEHRGVECGVSLGSLVSSACSGSLLSLFLPTVRPACGL